LEQVFELEKLVSGGSSDISQVASPRSQNSSQESIFEDHDMSKRQNKLLEQVFELEKLVSGDSSDISQVASPRKSKFKPREYF